MRINSWHVIANLALLGEAIYGFMANTYSTQVWIALLRLQ